MGIVQPVPGFEPKIINGKVTTLSQNQLEIRQNQAKCGFIYWQHGICQVNPSALKTWFANCGRSFYDRNFQYIDKVLYGWNGKYWVADSEFLNEYTYKKIYERFHVAIPERSMDDIMKGCKYQGYILRRENRTNYSYNNTIIVTFCNGTLEIDFVNNRYKFHKGKFFKEHNALYMLHHDFRKELMEPEYWKQGFVGKYLLGYYNDEGRDNLQQFLAAVLIPEFELQQSLVIKGDGGDGKGVLMGALKKLFGDVVTELKVSDWDGKHDTSVLVGSILNITSEVPSREISLDTWKSVVSCDQMTINIKYKDLFSYKPICKHIMTVNSLPSIQVDKAVIRRMPVIKTVNSTSSKNRSVFFRREFEQDMDGLVSFMLQGLLRLHQNNFRELPGMKECSQNLIYQNDSTMHDFIEQCLEITECTSDFVPGKDGFELFDFWKPDHGKYSKDMTQSTFTRKLITVAKAMGKNIKSDSRKIKFEDTIKSARGIVGIKINKEWKEKLYKHNLTQLRMKREWQSIK